MEARNAQAAFDDVDDQALDLEALRPRWVGWVLSQLERRGLLVEDSLKPDHWATDETIDVIEFSQWLGKHLNVGGWRAILQQTRLHNELGEGEWDPASPRDLLDAVELVLQTAFVPAPEPPTFDDEPAGKAVTVAAAGLPATRAGEPKLVSKGYIVSEVEERDTALRNLAGMLQAQPESDDELQMPALSWLLAPLAAASVVKARATSAKAFAELSRARSEAMLNALHALENDTRSSAVLAQIEDLRKRLGPRLELYCREHNLAMPEPNTEQESSILLLLNAQLIALDDAQDEIARRGAELAREKIRAAQETARASLEASVLPERLQHKIGTNPIREKILAEDMRHTSATWMARLMGAAGGALSGLVTAAMDVLVASIAETAVVSGPPLIVFIMTLLTETVSHDGPLTMKVLSGLVGTALWNAALILGITLTGYAVWKFVEKRANLLQGQNGRGGKGVLRSILATPAGLQPRKKAKPRAASMTDYAADAMGLGGK